MKPHQLQKIKTHWNNSLLMGHLFLDLLLLLLPSRLVFLVLTRTGCVFHVHRHFLGMNLCGLNSSMSRHMLEVVKAEMPQNQKDWKEDGLFNLSYSLLFK